MSAAAQALKEAGNNAFRAGKHDEAISLYTEALKKDPSDATYPLNRSMCYLKLQKYAEAERDASKSLNLLPAGNPKALYRRGLARKALGKLAEAKQDFESVLKEEPKNTAAKTELDAVNKAAAAKESPQPKPSADEKGKGKAIPDAPLPAPSKSATKAIAIPTESTNPSTTSTRSNPQSLDSTRRAALKAAITPEPDGNSSDFMQPVSTRRLDSKKDTSAKPVAEQPSQSGENAIKHLSTESTASSASATKKDFKTLRAARDERTRSLPIATPATASSNSTTSPAQAQGLIPTELDIPQTAPPKTGYEFEKRWNDRSSWEARAALLLAIEREKVDLPTLFGQNLSPELVDGIIKCFAEGTKRGQPLRSAAMYMLDGISRCARFDFISLLCGETASLSQILDNSDTRSKDVLRAWGL